MAHVMNSFRSFIMVALCLNPVLIVASEFRPHAGYPIPGSQSSRSFGKNNGKGFAVMGLLYLGKFNVFSNIHFTNISTIISNIDVSGVKTVVNDNKVMLGAVVGAMSLLLLIKQIKTSEKFGPMYNESCASLSNVVESNKKHYVEKLPSDVQNIIWLCEKPFYMLYALIKKYIGMSQTTIMSSMSAPVAGKLLDCGFVCPIPLCSFTSIGWLSTGIILTKGYFDENFQKIETKIDTLDKNNKVQHDVTQKQIKKLAKQGNKHKNDLSSEAEAHTKKLLETSEEHKKYLSGQMEKGIKVIDQQLTNNNTSNIQEHTKTRNTIESLQTELLNVKTQQLLAKSEKERRRVEKEQKRVEAEKKRQEEQEALRRELNSLNTGQKEATNLITAQNNKIDKFGNIILENNKKTHQKIDNLQEGMDDLLFSTQHYNENNNKGIEYQQQPNYSPTDTETLKKRLQLGNYS